MRCRQQGKGWSVTEQGYSTEAGELPSADVVVVSLVEGSQQQLKDLCSALQQVRVSRCGVGTRLLCGKCIALEPL